MGFLQKLWKDRISQFPKRYALKQQANGITQQVELELQDGVVQEAGDTFNATTMNDLEQRIADAIEAVESGEGSIAAQLLVDNTPFYFDKKDGQFGFNTSPSRGADTFHPFSTIHTLTKTITSKTTTDLGERHDYRYVDTTGVVNTNSGTYTPTSRAASLDMGAANSYRYVNTNSVPNSNSGTYTFPANDTGGTKDLGATNTYRYVNAGNVYNKGKADGAPSNKNNGLVESSNKTCSFPATNGCIYAITSMYLNTNSAALPSVTNGTALLNKWCAYAGHKTSDNYSISALLLVKATSSTITIVAPSGGSSPWHSVAWCKLN